MQALKQRLTRKFDATVSKKNLKRITDAAKGLEVFPQKGILLSELYDIESDYRYNNNFSGIS